MADSFQVHNVTKVKVMAKLELVWENTTFGANTPKNFTRFDTTPTYDLTLNTYRNKARLKHVIMRKKIWDSLKLAFQIEIMGSKEEFKLNGEYDRLMLWQFIRARVKPSTKFGASRLKETIEKKELRDFGDDVLELNTWFSDNRIAIISEEGEGCVDP